MELVFFDANCRLGRTAAPRPEARRETADIAAELVHCGIRRALCYHALAREYAPAVGNALLQQEIVRHKSGGPEFVPGWVLLPPETREQGPLADQIVQMRAAGVRAVRLFPAEHQWRLNEWNAGRLLEMLEGQLLPTFIDLDQTDFDAVAAVCQQYSLLPLVLLRVGYRTCRYLYPLLEQHGNLHVDISLFQAHGAIEEVCARFGPDRLLFATGLPVVAPGPAVAQVTYADVSEEQKSLLAGGNLSRLLEAAYGN